MQDWHGKEAENVARIVETDSKSKVLQIFHPKKTLWLQFSKKKLRMDSWLEKNMSRTLKNPFMTKNKGVHVFYQKISRQKICRF